MAANLVASVVAGALLVPASGALPSTIAGNAVAGGVLGEGTRTALAAFTRDFGRPSAPSRSTPALRNCGVDAEASWHALTLVMDRGKVVGFAYGPARIPALSVVGGLTIGWTMGRARTRYGAKLRYSNADGGVWFLKTSTVVVDGFLTPSTGRPATAYSRVATIDVGVVGCPAQSP